MSAYYVNCSLTVILSLFATSNEQRTWQTNRKPRDLCTERCLMHDILY